MRTCSNALWLALVLLGCGPGKEQPDKERIRSRYHAMDSLFALDNMEAIASIYHDSACIVSYGRILQGREAITSYWGQLQGVGVAWSHEVEDLTVRGDRAIQYGTSELLYRSGEDTLISLVNYTLIWRRDAQGEWWIERDHYTPMPRIINE